MGSMEGQLAKNASGLDGGHVLSEHIANVLDKEFKFQKLNYEHEHESQGWIGNSFDFIKNKTGWDKENSSESIAQVYKKESLEIEELKKAAQAKDLSEFRKLYHDCTGGDFHSDYPDLKSSYKKPPHLSFPDLASKFKDSQKTGVETLATVGTTAAAGTVLLFVPGAEGFGVAMLARAGAVIGAGAVTHAVIKASDGHYANAKRDLATGAVVGGLAMLAAERAALNTAGLLGTTGILANPILRASLIGGGGASAFGLISAPWNGFLQARDHGRPYRVENAIHDGATGSASAGVCGMALGPVGYGAAKVGGKYLPEIAARLKFAKPGVNDSGPVSSTDAGSVKSVETSAGNGAERAANSTKASESSSAHEAAETSSPDKKTEPEHAGEMPEEVPERVIDYKDGGRLELYPQETFDIRQPCRRIYSDGSVVDCDGSGLLTLKVATGADESSPLIQNLRLLLSRQYNRLGRDFTDYLCGYIALSENAEKILAEIPVGSTYVGAGGSATVFRTPDGSALRVGPALERAPVAEVLQPETKVIGGYYVVEKMPFADTSKTTLKMAETMKQIMQSKGYDFFDHSEENVGVLNGKMVVVDGGAVNPIPTAPYADLPPVKPGFVRLFRAESAETGEVDIPDWVKDGSQRSGSAGASGRWWMRDPKDLDYYLNELAMSGEKSRVVYQDVPKEVAEVSRVGNIPMAKQFSRNLQNEWFLPPEYVGRGTTIDSGFKYPD